MPKIEVKQVRATATLDDREHQVKAGPRSASRLWVLDDVAECRRRADPSEGDAGDLDDGRRARRLGARAMG